MPIYEYLCDDCHHAYEALRPSSSRDDAPPCPACGGPGRKQFSAFAFKDGQYGRHFKAGAPSRRAPKPQSETKE